MIKQVAEKVLTEHVAILRNNLYSQDLEILDRHCRPIEAIVLRCHSLLEQQEWGKLLSNKIYLSEIKLSTPKFLIIFFCYINSMIYIIIVTNFDVSSS